MGSHRVGLSQFDAHMAATSLVSLGKGPEGPHFSELELGGDRATPSRQNEHASARTCASDEGSRRKGKAYCRLIYTVLLLSKYCSYHQLGCKAINLAADRQGDTSYSSIISDLEQRFLLGCDDDSPPLSSSQAVRTPIQMMGGLVSPHLLEAQVGT